MNVLFTIIILFLFPNAYAETTVYETTDQNGVPSFTNVPQNTQPSVKKIVIPDAPTPAEVNPEQQSIEQQQAAIAEQLQKIDSTEQQLKQQIEKAQANLGQAQQNLLQARQAMRDGTYSDGGDQYIDQDYITDLERNVDKAKQQLTTAEDAYNNYRNEHK